MLLFKEKLLKTRRINCIIVPVYENEEKSEGLLGYIYSDMDTLRQADTLMVRFEGQLESLTSMLNVIRERVPYIEYYKRKVPYPFKMFAPYLGLVHESEELTEDLENLINHLHIIGRTISFSEFITVPQAARINVSFTKSSFLTMREEIADYATGLYEAERSESPDGVYWVNSEEIERVGRMAEAIAAAFGGMSVKSASQVADAYKADTAVVNSIEAALDRENADFEDTFDPSEWEGFTPIQSSGDFSAFGSLGADTTTTTTTTATTATATSAPAAPAANAGMFEEDDDEDYLMQLSTTGVDRTNNLIS